MNVNFNFELANTEMSDIDKKISELKNKREALLRDKIRVAEKIVNEYKRIDKTELDMKVDYYSSDGDIYVRGTIDGRYSLLESGSWAQPDPEDNYGYYLPCEGPFDFQKLLDLKEKLEHEYPGLKIKLNYVRHKTQIDPGYIGSLRDIKLLHAGKTVLLVEEGKKWHVGWDIEDRYMIVSIDGIKHLYYSEDAHGGGMNNHVIEGTTDYDRTLKWLTS